jgi:fumarate hydratase class II
MLSNDYSRLHAACLVMAQQYDLPGIQARWLVMAQASRDLANVIDEKRRHSRNAIPLRLGQN